MSKEYTMEGQLVEVGKTQTFTNGFSKRMFVINDDKSGKYTNYVPFTVTNDRCDILDAMRVGEVYTVMFFINGRKWEGDRGTKYFVDNSARKITDANGKEITSASTNAEGADDMPF